MKNSRFVLAMGTAIVCLILSLYVSKNMDVLSMISLNPPATVLWSGGMISAFILLKNREQNVKSRYVEAFRKSLPWMLAVGTVFAFMRLFLALDAPALIGPAVVLQLVLLVHVSLILGLFVYPLRYRSIVSGEKVLDEQVSISPQSWSYILRNATAFAVLIFSLCLCLVLKHASDLIMSLIISPPSQVLFLGAISTALISSGGFKTFWKALKVGGVLGTQDVQAVLKTVRSLKIAIIFAATLGALFGLMKAMTSLDRPEIIGPSYFVAMVPLIYGFICYTVLVIPFEFRIKIQRKFSEVDGK